MAQQGNGVGQTPTISIQMNPEVFDKFEEWECEESDKQALRQLKSELEMWKQSFESKGAELKDFLDKVAKAEADVLDRMKKKRKTNEGESTDNGGGSGASGSGPSGGAQPAGAAEAAATGHAQAPSEAELQAEAERLSQERFQAAAAAKAAGQGVAAAAPKAAAKPPGGSGAAGGSTSTAKPHRRRKIDSTAPHVALPVGARDDRLLRLPGGQ